MLDKAVIAVVDAAIEGKGPTDEQALALMELDTFSPEAAYVQWGAGQIARKASGNVGQIFAQVGVDALPCPRNCGWCSFSADRFQSVDTCGVSEEDLIAQPDDLVRWVRTLDGLGVHLISLMATDALPFERYLDMIRLVRATVRDDMPIMANCGDMTLEQVEALREAGAQAVYHALRLGEGRLTDIDPAVRKKTISNIKQAGLRFMSCVEPVHQQVDPQELLDHMRYVAGLEPFASGVGILHQVQGTAMEHVPGISRARSQYLACVFRLIAGESIRYGAGGKNTMWVNAGKNARSENDYASSTEYLTLQVKRMRGALLDDERTVPERPLAFFFE